MLLHMLNEYVLLRLNSDYAKTQIKRIERKTYTITTKLRGYMDIVRDIWIRGESVAIKGRTNNAIIKKLKKQAGVDLRKHIKRVIFSEFFPGTWGIFYIEKNGTILAGIEFDERKPVNL